MPSAGKRVPAHSPPSRTWPLVTLTIAGLAVAAASVPSLAELFEDRRDTAFSWRLWTSHLTHGSTRHLVFGLLVLVPLALWRERRQGAARCLLEYAFLGAAVAIGIRVLHANWETYRGISGIAYGLLTLTLLEVIGSGGSAAQTRRRRAALCILVFLSIKTVYECLAGGWLVNATSLREELGVVYLPGSHLSGLLAALLLSALHGLWKIGQCDYSSDSNRETVVAAGSSASLKSEIAATP